MALVYILSWNWDFGDGEVSDLPTPTHEYLMPGEYTVTLTTTWNIGDIVATSTTVYTYEQDYKSGGRNVTKTRRCYRFAVPQEQVTQGIGWSEYNGEEWPFPIGIVGCCKILDENDEDVQLCIDGVTWT